MGSASLSLSQSLDRRVFRTNEEAQRAVDRVLHRPGDDIDAGGQVGHQRAVRRHRADAVDPAQEREAVGRDPRL